MIKVMPEPETLTAEDIKMAGEYLIAMSNKLTENNLMCEGVTEYMENKTTNSENGHTKRLIMVSIDLTAHN